ncbi:MAG: threonine synthase [Planctomycetes bacterium]|nr:threonine synthase [Planctomycetota bacterium]
MRAYFECEKEGCGKTYPLGQVVYRCERDGSLLSVKQDLGALQNQFALEDLRDVFDARRGRAVDELRGGVWRYKELVLPDIDTKDIVSMNEGTTPMIRAENAGAPYDAVELYVKLCGNDVTGSFKDLGMTVLVSEVNAIRNAGALVAGIACASTGDTSAALAAYGARAGIPVFVFLPAGKISTAQLVQPLAHGAHTLSLCTDFDGCMKLVQEVTERENLYLANSMNSLRIEGQKTIAFEILREFGWTAPDYVVVPGGNLGNVSAIAKGFREAIALGLCEKTPRMVCAQADAANPLYRAFKTDFAEFEPVIAKQTSASAIRIGNPVSYERAKKALLESEGIVETVSEDDLANVGAHFDRSGFFTCPQTGVALCALTKLLLREEIERGARIVVISTAAGLKFTEYKVAYHEGKLADVRSNLSGRKIELPANADAICEAIREIAG